MRLGGLSAIKRESAKLSLAVAVALTVLLVGGQVFAQGTWNEKTPDPLARNVAASAVINGILYIAGGGVANNCTPIGTLESYNPATDRWATLAPMPTPRWQFAGAALNGIFYAIGGQTGCGGGVATVEAYNPTTNMWIEKNPLPTTLISEAAVVLNGTLYLVGGDTGSPGTTLATLLAYEPTTDSWSAKTPMPTPRDTVEATAANGLLFAMGGLSPSAACPGGNCAVNEAYNPLSDSWSEMAPMPTARHVAGAALLPDGNIYVVGGNASGTLSNANEAYNPTTNTWSTDAPMPTARQQFSVGAVAGILYAVGGNEGPFNTDVNEAFTPAPACSVTYNGTFNGNLNITTGLVCIIDGTVTGNVTQSGGGLLTSNATIGGNLQITGGGTFSIASSAVNGDLQIQNIPAGSAQNQICATDVKGNLTFHNNGTAVVIGTTSTSCPGDTIGNDLQVNNNTAAVQVFDDTAGGNLQCQSNSSITGGGDTAKSLQGQCAGF